MQVLMLTIGSRIQILEYNMSNLQYGLMRVSDSVCFGQVDPAIIKTFLSRGLFSQDQRELRTVTILKDATV